jgi:hypothetical protein
VCSRQALSLSCIPSPVLFLFVGWLIGWLGFETVSHFVVQADFKLAIFLPQPPKCWDYADAGLLSPCPGIVND